MTKHTPGSVEEKRERVMSLVPEGALLLDSWKDQDDIVTCATKVFCDGEYACIVVESHVDDGSEDGKTAFNGVVFARGEMLQRVRRALQSADGYTGTING